jgi:hypothetical protein
VVVPVVDGHERPAGISRARRNEKRFASVPDRELPVGQPERGLPPAQMASSVGAS